MTDGAAASWLASNQIDLVIVGADRIAANGDVANKIGTLAVAIAAHHYRIPFYVAAPSSTLDHACRSGDQIPIEQRRREEITPFFLSFCHAVRSIRLTLSFISTRRKSASVIRPERHLLAKFNIKIQFLE